MSAIKLPPFPWERLEQLQKLHKLGIAAGVYVIIIGVFLYFLILPTMGDIRTLKQQIQGAEEQLRIKTSARKQKEIREAPIKLAKLKKEVEISRRFLPEKDEVDRLLKDISARARESGLNVIEFKPVRKKKAELAGDFLAKVPFTMILEGPYLNLTSFIYKVSQLPRIVHINSIRLAKPALVEGDLVLTTNLTGTTYRFVEARLPDDSMEEKPDKKGNKTKAKKK
ncbi:MAG: type 4a pilus biogenesis protein PilO [Deltaproteobacteria bacterium]|nr:type 4a pilus biogenesis protein PilO [Deltaproteobacteria bacterium]